MNLNEKRERNQMPMFFAFHDLPADVAAAAADDRWQRLSSCDHLLFASTRPPQTVLLNSTPLILSFLSPLHLSILPD